MPLRNLKSTVLSSMLALGAATALTLTTAPAAHAVGTSACTKYNVSNYNWADTTVNFRSGPSTSYSSKGLLRYGDEMDIICGNGYWRYGELIERSASGLPNGTRGWVHCYYLANGCG